jgi:hypothetical protein
MFLSQGNGEVCVIRVMQSTSTYGTLLVVDRMDMESVK